MNFDELISFLSTHTFPDTLNQQQSFLQSYQVLSDPIQQVLSQQLLSTVIANIDAIKALDLLKQLLRIVFTYEVSFSFVTPLVSHLFLAKDCSFRQLGMLLAERFGLDELNFKQEKSQIMRKEFDAHFSKLKKALTDFEAVAIILDTKAQNQIFGDMLLQILSQRQ